jgi:hypothetical protein
MMSWRWFARSVAVFVFYFQTHPRAIFTDEPGSFGRAEK